MTLTLADYRKAREIARDRLHHWLDYLRMQRMLGREEYGDLKDALIMIDRFRNDGHRDVHARNQETSVDFTDETPS